MIEGAAGFWSYVHDDNEGDQGRILSLAEHLRSQYRLATGEDLDLFVDRDIKWGEEWEARIGNVIAGTTFFIPIITPSYFKSQACRDELLKFVREAERLGLSQLVMPIYWREVRALEKDPENSVDEAIRIIGRYQRKDFRRARLEDESSAVFRKAVDDLAGELAKRTVEAETVQDVPLAPTVQGTVEVVDRHTTDEQGVGEHLEDDAGPGIIERLAVGEDALPAILGIMQQVHDQLNEVNEVSGTANEAFERADNAKAGLVITERFAHALTGPAGRIETLGSEYAAKLADLDGAIEAQLELVAGDDGPVDSQTRGNLESIMALSSAAETLASELEELLAAAAPLTKMSRSLRLPIRQLRTGLQGIVDGRTTILDWSRTADGTLRKREPQELGDDE